MYSCEVLELGTRIMIFRYFTCLLIFLVFDVYSVELTTSIQNTKPKFIVGDGRFDGICIDIISELNKELIKDSISIKYKKKESVPLKRILLELKESSTDLFCGLVKNKDRQDYLSYLVPSLYVISHVLIKRKNNDYEYQDIRDLDNKVILAIRGTATSKLISEMTQAKVVYSSSPTTMFDMLARRSMIDFAFYYDLSANYFIKDGNLKDELVIVKHPVRVDLHYMVTRKTLSKKIQRKINIAIENLKKKKVIKNIIKKYN